MNILNIFLNNLLSQLDIKSVPLELIELLRTYAEE